MKKIYYIPIIFIISLLCVLFIIDFIKFRLNNCSQIFLPTSLDALKKLCQNLINCYHIHTIEIHIFHALSFVFLQTWCIPGTSFFNLFGGAVFGAYKGTIICLILNTIGASFSFLLSKYFLADLFNSNAFLIRNKEKLRNLMESNKDNLIYYLIFLRIFPGSPNWLMNISFPHLNVSLMQFAFSVFVGIAPWNFFSCSAGSILRELTSTKDIMDSKKYIVLLSLACGFLLIPWIKSKFAKNNPELAEDVVEKHKDI